MFDYNKYQPDRGLLILGVRWYIFIIVAICIMAFIGGTVAFLGRWLAVPGQVLSPENVREQWEFAYTYEESLKAAAQQVCTAEQAVIIAVGDTEQTQRRSQLLAIQLNYARIQAEYDAKLRNAFEAGLVAPPDVSKSAPTLDQMKLIICTNSP